MANLPERPRVIAIHPVRKQVEYDILPGITLCQQPSQKNLAPFSLKIEDPSGLNAQLVQEENDSSPKITVSALKTEKLKNLKTLEPNQALRLSKGDKHIVVIRGPLDPDPNDI